MFSLEVKEIVKLIKYISMSLGLAVLMILTLAFIIKVINTGDMWYTKEICNIPDRLHPVSEGVLMQAITRKITEKEFRRFYHLPNSQYLKDVDCLVKVLY